MSVQSAPATAAASTSTSVNAELVIQLHAMNGDMLFDFVRHLGLPDDAAADAVQETLTRLWGELQRGTEVAQPLGWAYRTCYRLAMEHHRWRRRLARLMPRLEPRNRSYAGPEEAADRLAVWTMVDRLPPRQRHAIFLHYAADLPYAEVAEVLDISPSAARTHASRGLATLRQELTVEEIS